MKPKPINLLVRIGSILLLLLETLKTLLLVRIATFSHINICCFIPAIFALTRQYEEKNNTKDESFFSENSIS